MTTPRRVWGAHHLEIDSKRPSKSNEDDKTRCKRCGMDGKRRGNESFCSRRAISRLKMYRSETKDGERSDHLMTKLPELKARSRIQLVPLANGTILKRLGHSVRLKFYYEGGDRWTEPRPRRRVGSTKDSLNGNVRNSPQGSLGPP